MAEIQISASKEKWEPKTKPGMDFTFPTERDFTVNVAYFPEGYGLGL